MSKQEIEFLRASGFTIAEIMAMQPAGAVDQDPTPAPEPVQPAPAPAPEPAQPATQPAAPAPAQTPGPQTPPAPLDNNAEMTKLLQQILGAIQSGNRSAATIPTPEKLTPEEIAGKLY